MNELEERPHIDAALVRRLIAAQFPRWAHLPVEQVLPGGIDNRTFRLGDTLTVRLPSATGYAGQVRKEQRWLPKLAPLLPLPIPAPVAAGAPGEGFPFSWSVNRWLEGRPARGHRIGDLRAFAVDLAGFLTALQRIDPTGGPAPALHTGFRGGPLSTYDAQTRTAIDALRDGEVPGALATEIWEKALGAGRPGPPVWFHGDIAWGNLLVDGDGRLSAVIDFGCMGVGDPACEAVIAWTLFSGESRRVFREALGVDDATWARARGWALWKALIVLAASRESDEASAAESRRVLAGIFSEYGG
ncbi:aminoglycoside phosphotransferase family protein [Streptomyces xiamenensis]|uniref:aminoglycoside phosphotransferase family protein n=1 Tax=Streptomyces xiamenensis TaxID=408015 RepID=UPI0037CE1533